MDGHAVDRTQMTHVDLRHALTGGAIEHVDAHGTGHPQRVGLRVVRHDLGLLAGDGARRGVVELPDPLMPTSAADAAVASSAVPWRSALPRQRRSSGARKAAGRRFMRGASRRMDDNPRASHRHLTGPCRRHVGAARGQTVASTPGPAASASTPTCAGRAARCMRRHGVRLEHVKLADTAEVVQAVRAEKARPAAVRAVGRPGVDQRRELPRR
jgi:hypothetical protein